MKKRLSFLSTLPLRLRSLIHVRVLVMFIAFYTTILFGAALVRNYVFIKSSLFLGEYSTALYVVFSSLGNITDSDSGEIWFLGTALIAVNCILITEYVKRIKGIVSLTQAGAGLGGTFVFIFGLGCLSCGAILSVFAVSIAGTSSLPAFFVWGGESVAWFALVCLFVLTLWLFKKATDPFVC